MEKISLSSSVLRTLVVTTDSTTQPGNVGNNDYPRCCVNYNNFDDDGMYVIYKEEPLLSTADVNGRMCAMLLPTVKYYNVAQTLLRRGHFLEAHDLFVQALEQLLLLVDNEATIMAKFVLHHNIGYCLHKLKVDGTTTQRALQAYHSALQLATKFDLGSCAIATTYYCIGCILLSKSSSLSSENVGEPGVDRTTAIQMFQSALRACETTSESTGCYNDPHSLVLKGWIWNQMGRIYCSQPSTYAKAVFAYQMALSIRRKFCRWDSKFVAASICNLAQAYHLCGMYECAKQHYNEFLHLAHTSQKYRVDVPPIMAYLAEIHVQESSYNAAKALYRQAIDIARDVYTKSSPLEVAALYTKLGQLHYQLHEFAEALPCFIHGLQIRQSVLQWNDPQIVMSLLSIAQLHRKQGNPRDAMIRFRQVHSIQVTTFGANSLEVAATLSSMGLIQFEQRQLGPAYNYYLHALQIQQRHHDGSSSNNTNIAASLSTIGLVLYNQGNRELSKRYFTDSLHIRRCLFGPNHCENAILWYNLATISLEEGDDETALDYYKESLRIERCAVQEGNNNLDAIVLSLQHVAIVYQRRGQMDDAVEYFREAVVCEQSRNDDESCNNREAIGKLLNLLGDVYLHLGRTSCMMECYVQATHLLSETTIEALVDRMKMVGYKLYDLSKIHPPCSAAA